MGFGDIGEFAVLVCLERLELVKRRSERDVLVRVPLSQGVVHRYQSVR
jgi:hypothetical protein